MSKQFLRINMLARRERVESSWRESASDRVADHVLDLPQVREAKLISAFVSIGAEVSTHELIKRLIELKGEICLPRVLGPGDMVMHRVKKFPEGFIEGAYDILEPSIKFWPEEVSPKKTDLVIVPGVAFDHSGFRVGYGGGYYDRFLASTSGVFSVGLGFSFQIVDDIVPEKHDRPVDALVTEDGVQLFEKKSKKKKAGKKQA